MAPAVTDGCGLRKCPAPSTFRHGSALPGFGRGVTLRSMEKTVLEGRWLYKGEEATPNPTCRAIETLVRSFSRLGSNDGGQTTLYRDYHGGLFWECSHPQADLPGGGPPRLESLTSEEVQSRYPDLADVGLG